MESKCIPHIIHYCWFGNPDKPKSVEKFIKSWKKILPDYEFKEWNEKNCDLTHEIAYVQEAYSRKKYAFVSDYIRIKKLVEFGGIYLDTDVSILKRFDEIVDRYDLVLGFQGAGNLGTAFIASIPNHPLLFEFLESYSNRHFIREDGSLDLTSINVSLDPFVEKRGLDIHSDALQNLTEGICVYPTDYFCAFNIKDWCPEITENTYTVHYMASSWHSGKAKIKMGFYNTLRKLLGTDRYKRIRHMLRR